MLFTLSVLALIGLVVLGFIYYRHKLLPYLPDRLVELVERSEHRFRAYAPLSTFESQRDAGLSSAAFDLEGNIAGDSRSGLDERTAADIRRIMQTRRVTFDQARLIRHKEQMVLNGIDPNTGMPLDSKAVTHL